jgi:hypothetical protein
MRGHFFIIVSHKTANKTSHGILIIQCSCLTPWCLGLIFSPMRAEPLIYQKWTSFIRLQLPQLFLFILKLLSEVSVRELLQIILLRLFDVSPKTICIEHAKHIIDTALLVFKIFWKLGLTFQWSLLLAWGERFGMRQCWGIAVAITHGLDRSLSWSYLLNWQWLVDDCWTGKILLVLRCKFT